MRTDGANSPTNISSTDYSSSITNDLVQSIRNLSGVRTILFNDSTIPGVRPFKGHDNHMHVVFRTRAGCEDYDAAHPPPAR
jgi:penicillin-insensitive murein DD-endopeptidase